MSNFWIFHCSQYAADYKYVWVPYMPEFTIEVSVGASCINFWNWTFYFNLVTKLYFRYLLLWTSSYFPEFCFFELFIMLLHFRIYKYFSFCLTRKPCPKFSQISTMGFVIKSSVAHLLRSRWKNEKLKTRSYFW